MNALASLLSATSSPAAAKEESADVPVSYDHDDSQFDELMSQAMATPAKAGANRPETNGTVPRQTSLPAEAAPETDGNPALRLSSGPDASGAKTSAKGPVKKTSDSADTDAATAAGNGSPDAIQLINSAQDLPIQLLGAVLPSYRSTLVKGSGGAEDLSGVKGSADTGDAGGSLVQGALTSASGAGTDLAAKTAPGHALPGKLSIAALAPIEAKGTKSLAGAPAPATTAADQLIATHGTAHGASAKGPTAAPGKTIDAAMAGAAPATIPAKTAGTESKGPADATPDAQETPINGTSDVNLAAHAFPPAHGTLAAKQDVSMKKAENTIKVAGQNEQVLPGAVTASARAASPAVRGASASSATPHDSTLGNNIIPFSPASERGANSVAPTGSVAVSSLDDIRTRALDRTQDMVMQQAVRLVGSNADSLSVVIKPGAGMQLSLQLTQSAAGITAQAVLQHGDYDNLNRHWPELQDRLEQRGIKLAPLGSDEAAMSFANQNRGQQNRQQPPEERALQASAFAEFSLVGAAGVTGSPALPALASLTAGGWQSWA
jgi:hypothetical protein